MVEPDARYREAPFSVGAFVESKTDGAAMKPDSREVKDFV
jgi:hypothetical protein